MTQRTEPRLKMPRHRRGRAELEALRTLAREAALRGESLASIRARLHIPEPTLTGWARQDGYRQIDLKARAEAQKEAEAAEEAARGEGAAEAQAIREQAEELWELCEEMQDRPSTGARRQVALARARTLALAEAGHLEAAEEEMASVRRLARLLAFGRAGTGEMERFQTRALLLADDLEFQAALSGSPDEDAPQPPPPLPPGAVSHLPLTLDDLIREENERLARRNPWTALIEARKLLAEKRGEDDP
ncbi:hypothetical protein [Hyphomonas sp.]|uniref:hypothetical protein n=1 Tax=Hyphomonas sp. TaxID=87 RepID=UPI003242C57E